MKILISIKNQGLSPVIISSIWRSRFHLKVTAKYSCVSNPKESVRELKKPWGVFFEEQRIHSLSGEGELMLSILSSIAQEESRSPSENQKWRVRKDFREGKVSGMKMLGYRPENGRKMKETPRNPGRFYFAIGRNNEKVDIGASGQARQAKT